MRMTKTTTEILKTLTEFNGSMSSEELAKATGCTGSTALKNARKLVKAGQATEGKRGRAAVFAAGETVVETNEPKAQREGTLECQVCEGFYTDRKDGTTWNHGYKRPGCGYLVGKCFGAEHAPFPATDRLEAYAAHLVSYAASLAETLANAANWTTLTVKRYVRHEIEFVTIKREDVPTDEAIAAARDEWSSDANDWTDERQAKHKAWAALISKREQWTREHKTKVWSLGREQKQVASEQERVAARIKKGRALRGEV